MTEFAKRLLPTRRSLLTAALAGLAAWVAIAQPFNSGSPADMVSLSEARALLESGKVMVFDVREPEEHATGVIQGARLLPRSQLNRRMAEIPTDATRPVLLICATQNRSRATLSELRSAGGYAHVRYVQGGMSGWKAQAWPTVKPAAAS
jgi:rhodanese-related sulfurtransferase